MKSQTGVYLGIQNNLIDALVNHWQIKALKLLAMIFVGLLY